MFQRTICQPFSENFQREQKESISKPKDSASGCKNADISICSSEQIKNFRESVIRVRFVLNLFQTLRNGWAITVFDTSACRVFRFPGQNVSKPLAIERVSGHWFCHSLLYMSTNRF